MRLRQPGLIFKVPQRAILPSFTARHLRSPQTKRRLAESSNDDAVCRMNMKSPFAIRLWTLIAALLLVAGGTIYGLFSAWHRIQQLEAKLTNSQIESSSSRAKFDADCRA